MIVRNQIETLFETLAMDATNALIIEAQLTPKPGLVDKQNDGAHNDMNFSMLQRSAKSFTPYFYAYGLTGFTYGFDLGKILPAIRRIGWRAEQQMFVLTRGVNTHKGANFSFGVFLSSLGAFYRQRKARTYVSLSWDNIDAILLFCKQICSHLLVNDLAQLATKAQLSHGEQVYLTHGIKGIRGELASGFSTLQQHILPLLRTTSALSHDVKYLAVLLKLMCYLTDTNILYRGGFGGLEYVQTLSRNAFLAYETNPHSLLEVLQALDEAFISKNLSPSGSADLLALSIFIDILTDTKKSDMQHHA